MKNISKAIINVMKTVKGVEKNLTVGTGYYSYQGVSDKDVKQIIGKAMQENGLAIIPIDIEATATPSVWTEDDKRKQQVFTEVKVRYLLLHESGESIELMGYGHGTDSQDKSAGKATTYALKYTLLYSFLVPTGKIDDSDNIHSSSYDIPSVIAREQDLLDGHVMNAKQFKAALQRFNSGEIDVFQKAIDKGFVFTSHQMETIKIAEGQVEKGRIAS